jgi:hypothetical protein
VHSKGNRKRKSSRASQTMANEINCLSEWDRSQSRKGVGRRRERKKKKRWNRRGGDETAYDKVGDSDIQLRLKLMTWKIKLKEHSKIQSKYPN